MYTNCEACDIGSYKPLFGPTDCTSCGADTETASQAAIARSACQCKQGFTAVNGGPGMLGGSCDLPCQKGRSRQGGSCHDCAKGSYKAAQGSQSCTQCPGQRTRTKQAGSNKASNCLCEIGQIALADDQYVEVASIGSFQREQTETVPVNVGETAEVSFQAGRKFTSLTIQINNAHNLALRVRIGTRTVFKCARRCPVGSKTISVARAKRKSLFIDVLSASSADAVSFQVAFKSRPNVGVKKTMPDWVLNAREAFEDKIMSAGVKVGEFIFRSTTPFSADTCKPCPPGLRCQ